MLWRGAARRCMHGGRGSTIAMEQAATMRHEELVREWMEKQQRFEKTV
jgi:hypothetical protein